MRSEGDIGGRRVRKGAMALLAATAGAICASTIIAILYAFIDPSRIPIEVAMTATISYIVGLPIAVYVIGLTSRVGAAERARIEAEVRQNESELARMEAERANRSAQAADRMRLEFLARMSHEVRTPMNGILGMAEVLKNTELSEDQKFYVSTIASSGDELLTMINDVLEMSSIAADRMTLREDRFDPHRLFADVAARIVDGRKSEGVEFRLIIEPDAPATLIGDEARLSQVAANLIDNALRFTEAGFVEARIAVRRTGGGDQANLSLTVSDTGPGVSPEEQDAIFDSFHQVDGSSTRTHQGPGLGLAIVASIARLMKGEVKVESAPGRGAVFRFDAPVAIAPADAAGPLEGERVVVVSADGSWGERLVAALSAAGADAMTSADFTASAQALKARAFAFAVLDMREALPAPAAKIAAEMAAAAAHGGAKVLHLGGLAALSGADDETFGGALPGDATPGAVVDAIAGDLKTSAFAPAE